MAEYKAYINALRKCAKEHENEVVSFAHIRTTDLCNDTADLLERLDMNKNDINDKAIKAIPLEKVKKAREEIEQNAYPIVHGVNNHDMGMTLNGIFQVLDKLIESEG